MCVYLAVSVTSWYCIEMTEWIELALAERLLSGYFYTVEEIWVFQ